jgi:hypothetical protein
MDRDTGHLQVKENLWRAALRQILDYRRQVSQERAPLLLAPRAPGQPPAGRLEV